jgi:Kef-type K+ transport system membrane component KefB
MISRGEVGLIVTAMGASTGIFREPEVAVMVTVVLLTTLLTPLIMRGAFMLKCAQDEEDKGENIENTVSSAECSTIIELQPEA